MKNLSSRVIKVQKKKWFLYNYLMYQHLQCNWYKLQNLNKIHHIVFLYVHLYFYDDVVDD